MPSVMGVNVRGILGATVGAKASDATLSRTTSLGRTPGAATSGTNVTSDDYPCKGYVSSYTDEEVDGDGIKASDRKITIYAETLRDEGDALIVPQQGDRVTIAEDGLDPETYRVLDVGRGTAGARYILHGRK